MPNSIVEAILSYASATPDKLCLADDNEKLSYSEYAVKILRYATYLFNIGIGRNDKVVMESCQTVDYLAITHALQLVGAIFVPVEHNCAAEKVKGFADRVSAKALVVVNSEKYDGYNCYTYSELLESSKSEEPMLVGEFPSADSVSEILFSTGTTGKEKGIIITHSNDVALAGNVMHGVEMEKDNVEMIPSPMNHSHGLRRYYANMYNGSTVVLLGSVMNVMKFFRNIDEYGVNSMDLVPSALSVVLKLSKNKLSEYADRLRYIQLGAAPLLEQDRDKICALLPKTRLYNFYGSTESGCTCIYNFNTPNTKANCIGKPTYNTQLLIVDDDRNPIDTSSKNTGLLATRGGMNMLGYWEDEAETAAVLADGVVYSNDIAFIDDDGDVILLGRKGDVINVGGNKVSPDEIENAAKEMPEIADCGCIPIPDASKGQVPKLFVQIASGAEFNPINIRSFLSKKLEPYKVPAIIEQIDLIPRSYNGKLLRKELK